MPVRGGKASEFPRLNELMEASYKNADKDHRFITLYKEKPLVDNWSRVYEYIPGIDSGLPLEKPMFVAHVGIWRQPMQFGQVKIVNGGLRDVCSHPIARGKKFGLLTVKDAREFMLQQEVDISILFTGSHHFYNKNGWESGLTSQTNVLPHAEYTRWKQTKKTADHLEPDKIMYRCVEEGDVPQVAKLYQATQSGLYLAAERDEQYWRRHFEVRQYRMMDFIVAEFEGKILAYFRFDIRIRPNQENELVLKEMRILPVMGANEINIIFQQFCQFIEEEAMQSGTIYQISFTSSSANRIIQHLIHEGYKLDQNVSINMGHMVLITNPYSFFTRITPEIQARSAKLPKGSFAIKFENQGELKGGVVINNVKGNCNVEVCNNDDNYLKIAGKIPDRVGFQNISKLTLIALGIIKVDDLDHEEVTVEGKAASWLEGLFTGISSDMSEMDHF